MFFSQIPLTTQLVIGGVLVAFEFGVLALVIDFARRTIRQRRAKRAAFSAQMRHAVAGA